MSFLWSDKIILTRKTGGVFCRFNMFYQIFHSETLLLFRFHHILPICISDLLPSFRFVLIINFLDYTSTTIELIIATFIIIINNSWSILSGMQTLKYSQSAWILSSRGRPSISAVSRLQVFHFNYTWVIIGITQIYRFLPPYPWISPFAFRSRYISSNQLMHFSCLRNVISLFLHLLKVFLEVSSRN